MSNTNTDETWVDVHGNVRNDSMPLSESARRFRGLPVNEPYREPPQSVEEWMDYLIADMRALLALAEHARVEHLLSELSAPLNFNIQDVYRSLAAARALKSQYASCSQTDKRLTFIVATLPIASLLPGWRVRQLEALLEHCVNNEHGLESP